MKDKKQQHQPADSQVSAEAKMSQMIWEFAGDYIRVGDTFRERLNFLNDACSAWNIASEPPGRREASLNRYIVKFRQYNPDADEAELAEQRSKLEKLIARKLEMFPGDTRQIVDARIVPSGDKECIEVKSRTFSGG